MELDFYKRIYSEKRDRRVAGVPVCPQWVPDRRVTSGAETWQWTKEQGSAQSEAEWKAAGKVTEPRPKVWMNKKSCSGRE